MWVAPSLRSSSPYEWGHGSGLRRMEPCRLQRLQRLIKIFAALFLAVLLVLVLINACVWQRNEIRIAAPRADRHTTHVDMYAYAPCLNTYIHTYIHTYLRHVSLTQSAPRRPPT